MSTPKRSNSKRNQNYAASATKTTTVITRTLVRILLFFLLMLLWIIFGPTRQIIDQHHTIVMQQQYHPGPINAVERIENTVEVDVMELEHEEMFLGTIKDCLPSSTTTTRSTTKQETNEKESKCKQYVGPTHVQRVAILAPPGDTMSAVLTKRVQSIVHQHNKNISNNTMNENDHSNQQNDPMEVIVRTHVPPYGYGKSHGLTKVLRVVPQPLLLQVTDALQSVLLPGETHASITLNDLKGALRQILRYHCRISHLAAHTALFSVTMDTNSLMETNDHQLLQSLQSFLIPSINQNQNSNNEEEEFDHMINDDDDDADTIYQVHAMAGTQTLTHIQEVSKISVLDVLDQVLRKEMERSKNLSIWPCLSFWDSGEDDDDDDSKNDTIHSSSIISPLLQRLAKALSPDCNDPFAKCWVERDICEAKGDAICSKKGHKQEK